MRLWVVIVCALAASAAAGPVHPSAPAQHSRFWARPKLPSKQVLEHRRAGEALLERAGDNDVDANMRAIIAGEAADLFQRAVNLDRSQVESWYELGVAEYYAQHWKGCVTAFDELRKLDASHPRERDISFYIAIALAKQGTGFERIIDEYNRWLRGPDELAAAPVTVQGGFNLSRRAQTEGNLAETYMALGRLPEAIEHYRRADELQPGFPLTLYGMAVAYDRDEQSDQARRAMTRALGLDPTMGELARPEVFFVPEGDVHYYYALGYEATGHPREALREWKAFVSETPGSRYLERARAHIAELGGR